MADLFRNFLWTILLVLGFTLAFVSCAGPDDSGTSEDVSGIKLPNPEEGEEQDQAVSREISGVFALADTLNVSSSRTYRAVPSTLIVVEDRNGTELSNVLTDTQGNFLLAVSIAPSQLPVSLRSTVNNVTYASAIAQFTGATTAHLNEITTVIAENFATRSDLSQENLSNVTRLVMMQHFGVNGSGEPNLPETTFTQGDFSNPESLGNVLLNTAANAGISLLDAPPEEQPLLANTIFVESLAVELRELEDPSEAIDTVASQEGSDSLAQNLSSVVEASEEAVLQEINSLAEEVQQTQEAQQSTIDELEQQIETLDVQAEADGTATNTTVSETTTTTLSTPTTTTTVTTTTVVAADSGATTTTSVVITTTTTLAGSTSTTSTTSSSTLTSSTTTSSTTTTTVVSNNAPTDISLSSTAVAENQSSGTSIGLFSTTDTDSGDSHTYSFASGTGSTDNGNFNISGSLLLTAATFDFETKNSYSIRVRTTDSQGATYEEVFTISVSNLDEAPSSISTLSASNPSETTVDLTWTAVGTDESSGSASSYDIRYSTSDISSDSLCDSATAISQSLTPKEAGNTETLTATVPSGLSGVQYYFCIRAVDSSGLKGTWTSSGVTSITTATLTHTDISASQGSNSGYNPEAAIDTTSSKLLVVTENRDNNTKLSLFRCDLDGSNCTHTDISTGQGTFSGEVPDLVIDSTNSKILAVTQNSNNADHPSLFRCDLDGSNCTHTDIGPSAGSLSGVLPTIGIDTHNSKVLVATQDGNNGYRARLFRCDLDGSSCSNTDISAGQGLNSGEVPQIAFSKSSIDASTKVLVVTQNIINLGHPGLFQCDLDGTSCSHTDLSTGTGQGNSSGKLPVFVVDHTNSKLLVVTKNENNSSKPSLWRCDLDGSNCTHTDISTGQGANSNQAASTAIDTTNSKLLVATQNGANSNKLSLFRCDLDGSNCTHTDISSGQDTDSGTAPSLVIDTTNSKILVVTQNGANNNKLSLFRLPLSF